jgi:uracil-DNA glycosylase family 4
MLRYPDTDRRLALAEGCERCPDLVACRNREPTATERENCRPYLRGELDRIGPEVVVPTGKHASRTYCGRS